MLEPQERPDPTEHNAIERQVEEISDALWDGVQIQVALKGWVNAVSPYGEFDNNLTSSIEIGRNPKIHLAPAVILRKRTERSLLRVLHEILEQLRSGLPIPVGVERLVTIVDDSGTYGGIDVKADDDAKSPLPSALKEIYFPLPANKEQLEIAEQTLNPTRDSCSGTTRDWKITYHCKPGMSSVGDGTTSPCDQPYSSCP